MAAADDVMALSHEVALEARNRALAAFFQWAANRWDAANRWHAANRWDAASPRAERS